MFYRYIGLRRSATDLDNLFSGACFLVGGGPQHREIAPSLVHPNIVTMAMNNVGVTFKPTLWIGCDRATNYSESILRNPSIMKFAQHNRMGCEIAGTKWRALPNTYFFPHQKDMLYKNFFVRGKYIGWWKNVFTAAVQVLYRLGFRTVYTVGCGFDINPDDPYGFPSDMDAAKLDWNKNTYNLALRQMSKILRYAPEANFELISCTPRSRLNKLVPYKPFEVVWEQEIARVPEHDSVHVTHPVEQAEDANS